MNWKDIKKIPFEFHTAAEIGVSAQTLSAFAKRGIVEIKNGSPKMYKRNNKNVETLYELCEKFLSPHSYFTLWKKGKEIGMLCSMASTNYILDCYENPYDLTDVYCVEFKKGQKFLLETN